MSHRESIMGLMATADDLADRLSELREEYSAIDCADPELVRFGQLSDVEDTMFNLSLTLSAYLAMPSGAGVDQAVLMITEYAVRNASILADVVGDEVRALQTTSSSSGSDE